MGHPWVASVASSTTTKEARIRAYVLDGGSRSRASQKRGTGAMWLCRNAGGDPRGRSWGHHLGAGRITVHGEVRHLSIVRAAVGYDPPVQSVGDAPPKCVEAEPGPVVDITVEPRRSA